ncbi:acyl-CoA-binding domain-containing protein 6-like isoform X2 [Anneissia japonica]|uniref:acyl-CoA-binding domain-containing protein 6-like isoform X2 n=1 Tax=Anneissia japonica TaxID=1529436 RepID=UPI001425702C|nr:acyl-CoA-binding domain-containing protein 6-like isoform X2 [Anneissia japonica]
MDVFSNQDLNNDFQQAAEHVKSIVGSLADEQLLKLYARYKQATTGRCNIPKPHMFDFQGRSKWNAWSQLGDMSSEDAMAEYISVLDSLDGTWRSKITEEKGVTQSTSFGMSVSTMKKGEDEVLSDSDKTVFDWCKEGNLEELKKHIATDDTIINKKDEEGLCLLHWSCDRGFEDIVRYLLAQKASIDQQDSDGQTALHYACTCERNAIVEMLLEHGANPNVRDTVDCVPADNTENQHIHSLLKTMSTSCPT